MVSGDLDRSRNGRGQRVLKANQSVATRPLCSSIYSYRGPGGLPITMSLGQPKH